MAIISEFMSDAHEVGSLTLVEKYGMDVSSATIRSEMVKLMENGFLEKSHISSGRTPTDQAIRLYVKQVVDNSRLSPIEEAVIRQALFKVRFSENELIKGILDILVNYAKSTAFVFSDDMSRYFGVSSLMRYDELKSVEVLERVLDLLDNNNLLRQVFTKYDSEGVSLLIGEESGIKDLRDCAIAFSKVYLHNNKLSHIGIIGPRRMDYTKAVPLLKSVRQSVEDSLKGWR